MATGKEKKPVKKVLTKEELARENKILKANATKNKNLADQYQEELEKQRLEYNGLTESITELQKSRYDLMADGQTMKDDLKKKDQFINRQAADLRNLTNTNQGLSDQVDRYRQQMLVMVGWVNARNNINPDGSAGTFMPEGCDDPFYSGIGDYD